MSIARPTSKAKKRWLASSLIAVLLVVTLIRIGTPARDDVIVRYLGLTNDVSVGWVALLCVTNQTVFHLVCSRELTSNTEFAFRVGHAFLSFH